MKTKEKEISTSGTQFGRVQAKANFRSIRIARRRCGTAAASCVVKLTFKPML